MYPLGSFCGFAYGPARLDDRVTSRGGGYAAIIDAILISSAARPNRYEDCIPEDRQEIGIQEEGLITRYSADIEARWIKKGRKSVLGYKGFARCDEEGFERHSVN